METAVSSVIAPYTDLKVHDLGADIGDEERDGSQGGNQLWRHRAAMGIGYRAKGEELSQVPA